MFTLPCGSLTIPHPALPQNRQPRNDRNGHQLPLGAPSHARTSTTAEAPTAGHAHACLNTAEAPSNQQEHQAAPPKAGQAGNEVHSTQPPSQAVTLDGRESSAAWLEELRPSVTEVTKALGRAPGLCVIHVGDRPDSSVYVRRKEEACEQVTTVPHPYLAQIRALMHFFS